MAIFSTGLIAVSAILLVSGLVDSSKFKVVSAPPRLATQCKLPLMESQEISDGDFLGLLSIPQLSLQNAPVYQGTDDSVLLSSVGHVTSSVLPGQRGTAVLAAHDISYFSALSSIHPGSLVTFNSGCQLIRFEVSSTQVVADNYPVINSATPSLILVTCYPTDALYLTNQRFVVYAKYLNTVYLKNTLAMPKLSTPTFHTPAPKLLRLEAELSFPYLPFQLSTLQYSGSPSPQLKQSVAPAEVETVALNLLNEIFFSLASHNKQWLNQLGFSNHAIGDFPFLSAPIRYSGAITITINAYGNHVSNVELKGTLYVQSKITPFSLKEKVKGTQISGEALGFNS